MDGKQAIETLRANYPDACYGRLREAVDVAIKALKAYDTAGDTISRQAAIASLQKCKKHCIDPFDSYHIDISDAERRLIEVPPVQPEPKWIPVSEGLPEEQINPNTMDFEKVLCSTAFGDVRTYGYGKPTGYDVSHFWHSASVVDPYVKAWQPLPEPYKEVNHETD